MFWNKKKKEEKNCCEELKQVIIIRTDLKMPKGKTASQAAHASVEAVLRTEEETIKKWRLKGMKKIVVKAPDEKTLVKLFQEAKNKGLPTSLITDAGKTTVEPGTKTAVAIGPAKEEEIDKITGELPLL